MLDTTSIEHTCLMEHVQSDTHLATLCQPHPCSNDLIKKCFMNNFLEKKNFYFTSMSTLLTLASGFISLNHNFKIAINIGYLRQDGRWICQYNSVLFV